MIPYWQKDSLRTELKGLKKRLDDIDKARKAAVINEVSELAKQMIAEKPDQKIIVHEFKAGSNAKVKIKYTCSHGENFLEYSINPQSANQDCSRRHL